MWKWNATYTTIRIQSNCYLRVGISRNSIYTNILKMSIAICIENVTINKAVLQLPLAHRWFGAHSKVGHKEDDFPRAWFLLKEQYIQIHVHGLNFLCPYFYLDHGRCLYMRLIRRKTTYSGQLYTNHSSNVESIMLGFFSALVKNTPLHAFSV